MHRFAARLPGGCASWAASATSSSSPRNYDTALERAFDAVHEPYDLVVFVATGEHSGRFVHVPWWDPEAAGPGRSRCPTSTWTSRSTRTARSSGRCIVKLHGGAADLGKGWPSLRDNFVITEDDYIGYLTQSPVESLIPLQILNKVRDSHFLFLGYRMRDWSVRVFLQRIWGEHPLEARSWAVDPGSTSSSASCGSTSA